jgi:hypothetical protein
MTIVIGNKTTKAHSQTQDYHRNGVAHLGVGWRDGGSPTPGATMSGWKSIATAPFDQDVQLWVIDRFGARALAFPCRRTDKGWINSQLKVALAATIKPAYWREWPPDGSGPPEPPIPSKSN